MCQRKRVAVFIISILACSSQFMTSYAEFQCSENAFGVQVGSVIPSLSLNLEIILFLKLTLAKDSKLPGGVTLEDYALECIAYDVCQAGDGQWSFSECKVCSREESRFESDTCSMYIYMAIWIYIFEARPFFPSQSYLLNQAPVFC
jgi:hypothetical protein